MTHNASWKSDKRLSGCAAYYTCSLSDSNITRKNVVFFPGRCGACNGQRDVFQW